MSNTNFALFFAAAVAGDPEASSVLLDALLERCAQDGRARERARRTLGLDVERVGPIAYTTATLAGELGVTPRAVRAAIERGDLAASKRAGRWVIGRQAVEDWARPKGDRRSGLDPTPASLRRRASEGTLARAVANLDRAA